MRTIGVAGRVAGPNGGVALSRRIGCVPLALPVPMDSTDQRASIGRLKGYRASLRCVVNSILWGRYCPRGRLGSFARTLALAKPVAPGAGHLSDVVVGLHEEFAPIRISEIRSVDFDPTAELLPPFPS